jgi:hypothetical protein
MRGHNRLGLCPNAYFNNNNNNNNNNLGKNKAWGECQHPRDCKEWKNIFDDLLSTHNEKDILIRMKNVYQTKF